MGADQASLLAGARDEVPGEPALVDESAQAVVLEAGCGCHVASGSLTMLSCSPMRVSVKTRLAVPRGRMTTTSKACARPRASARRIVRRPARSRKQTALRSKTTRLGTGGRERRSSACSTSGTAARSNSPARRTCKVASDSSTATSNGLGRGTPARLARARSLLLRFGRFEDEHLNREVGVDVVLAHEGDHPAT